MRRYNITLTPPHSMLDLIVLYLIKISMNVLPIQPITAQWNKMNVV